MTRGKAVNRLDFHVELFKLVDRTGKLEIYQTALAKKLDVTQATMSHLIRDLVADGRITKIGARPHNVGLYFVRDPKTFEHKFDGYEVPGIGVERCSFCGAMYEGGPHAPRRTV